MNLEKGIYKMKVGEVPYSSLKVGDRVISCEGKHGTIGQLVDQDPWGNNYDDWGGGILFLWNHDPSRTFSYSGWSDSEVIYLGDDDYPDPCGPLCNFRRRVKVSTPLEVKRSDPESSDYLSSKVSLEDSLKRPSIVSMEDFKSWVDSITSNCWSWVKNTRCKYVTIRIDTRRGVYSIKDRDGREISLGQLFWQYSKDTPEPPT